MKTLLAIFACLVLAYARKDYTGYHVYEVLPVGDAQKQALRTLEAEHDFWSPTSIMVTPEKEADFVDFLTLHGIQHRLAHADVQTLLDEFEAKRVAARAKSGNNRLDWEDYYTLAEINEWLDEVVQNYPGVVTPLTAGYSYENREIRVLRINHANAEKKVWLDAGIHAREWIAPAFATYVVNELTANYANNQAIADEFDWYIIVNLNPDGYEFSHTDDRLWRKTRSDNGSPGCLGADPNRNFDYHWGEVGTSDNPCSEIFCGLAPFSEPETEGMSQFLKGLNEDGSVQMYFTIHSYSQVIVSPWSWTDERPDDFADLEEIGFAAVDAIEAVHGTDFFFSQSTQYFGATAGSSDDWAKAGAGIAISYTWELRPDSSFPGFILPPEEIIPCSEETWAGIQAALAFKM